MNGCGRANGRDGHRRHIPREQKRENEHEKQQNENDHDDRHDRENTQIRLNHASASVHEKWSEPHDGLAAAQRMTSHCG